MTISSTICSTLDLRSPSGRMRPVHSETSWQTAGSLIMVDEGSMVSLAHLSALVEYAARNGCKLVLAGCPFSVDLSTGMGPDLGICQVI